MTFPKVRPIVFGLLFLGWLGYLCYFVATAPTDIVSRPQLLAAPICIIGEIREDDDIAVSEVAIVEILYAPRIKIVGEKVTLRDLSTLVRNQGYRGPGKYILPLAEGPDGTLELAAVPRLTARSGRFPASHADVTIAGNLSRRHTRRVPMANALGKAVDAERAGYKVWLDDVNLRIYPLNDGTRRQADEILKARH